MKTIIIALSTLLLLALQDQAPVMRSADLFSLTGPRWTGTLTYLDYSTSRKVSIPSTLLVTPVEGQHLSFTFDYQYPDEPHARSTSTLSLSGDGREFAGARIIERRGSANSPLILVMEKNGRDNDREALIRHTYQIETGRLSIRKEVRYSGTTQFLLRNEYVWQR
ncbi:MAG: hypothetical protein ACKOB4_02700 [Acidobacteriota bacterium]